jgi:FtsZ-binding cell division protein ZapB
LLYCFRVNTKEKDLKDELAESSRKQQKLNEENNKLKDQLTRYQDKLKYVLIIKKNVDFHKH